MTLDANTLGHMVDEKLFHLEAERDEARKEASDWKMRQADARAETETQGRQLAALRTVLDDAVKAFDSGALRMTSNKVGSQSPCAPPQHPWHEEWLHLVRTALTDTAAASAQWVRVDDEHVVAPQQSVELVKPVPENTTATRPAARPPAPAAPEPEDGG